MTARRAMLRAGITNGRKNNQLPLLWSGNQPHFLGLVFPLRRAGDLGPSATATSATSASSTSSTSSRTRPRGGKEVTAIAPGPKSGGVGFLKTH